MSKHTPGPWIAGEISIASGWIDIAAEGHLGVASATPAEFSPSGSPEVRRDAETIANARLIAAAPELLEALIRARRALAWACEERGEFEAEYELADAAIAKATGA